MAWVKIKGSLPSLYNQVVTKGSQLRENYDVGPYAIQRVIAGTEELQSMTGPGRGFWRFDEAAEFTSDTAWPSDADDAHPDILNDLDLHEGKVTGSPVVIDGFTVPVGTYICQFRDFPDGYDFYCQTTTLPIMFRGCRFRSATGLGGAGLFNDNGSAGSQHIYLHYCDLGLNGGELAADASGLFRIGLLGGSNHRVHRCHYTWTATALQPNTQGVSITETWIDHLFFPYGEAGTSGAFDTTAYHINGCSSEGGITDFIFERNHVEAPSPDGVTGANGFTAEGESGYGTQSGQVGYGTGSNPGRTISQTDCIALFNSNFLTNIGSGPGAISIADNFFAGGAFCVYAGQHDASYPAENIGLIGNEFSTKYWTNGGANGPVAAQPDWDVRGNAQSGNVWYDDYGTGGDGNTLLADRQYPNGDGPRVGTSVI